MHREKEELVDGPYRRDFLTYDNHILDGEIFLQVSFYEIVTYKYYKTFTVKIDLAEFECWK